MIIVEGMDNTGKSTLVRTLADLLGRIIINNRSKPRDFYQIRGYTKDILELAKSQPIICDRWPTISEQVYGSVVRGGSVLNMEKTQKYLSWLKEVNCVVIYCRPPSSEILRFRNEPQMDGVIDRAPQLIQAYDDIMLMLVSEELPVLTYDYTKDSIETLIDQLVRMI